jgi:hypothetical protein
MSVYFGDKYRFRVLFDMQYRMDYDIIHINYMYLYVANCAFSTFSKLLLEYYTSKDNFVYIGLYKTANSLESDRS